MWKKTIKLYLVAIINYIKNKKRKFSLLIYEVTECRECIILHEQLDIERRRYDSLLEHLLGKGGSIEDDEEKLEQKEIREVNNWTNQKKRLQQKSVASYAAYMREKEANNASKE